MIDLNQMHILAGDSWLLWLIFSFSLLAWGLMFWTWLKYFEIRKGTHISTDHDPVYTRACFNCMAFEMKQPLAMVLVLASCMPLLGLLGTVVGMTETFDAMAVNQTRQIDKIAGGISQALITTQTGLLFAMPILLCRHYLSRRIDERLASIQLASEYQ